jgi:D-alanyl-D-alanine carboxypeptidase (penicillin-binding protein 5/6)
MPRARDLARCAIAVVVFLGCGGPRPPDPVATDLPPVTVFAADSVRVPRLPCASAFLVEAATGQVLFAQDADLPRAPASIAKMMLELIVMEKVDGGEIGLDDPITASGWSSKIGGSQVYLKEGEVFPVRDLMKAVAIASANDACVALAEHIAGSVDAFVDMMNRRAEQLDLGATRYTNVHGLDDDPTALNITTARDIARIGQELIRHPKILEWSSLGRETFRDSAFVLENTNTLIGRFRGMDGIKTGYTERAGYNLCSSAERDGLRLVSVVLGAESRAACADMTSRILSAAFNEIKAVDVAVRDKPLLAEPIAVKHSQSVQIHPLPAQGVRVFVPSHRARELRIVPEVDDPVVAPLLAGSPVGEAWVEMGSERLARVVLVSDRAVEAKGVQAWFRGVFGG